MATASNSLELRFAGSDYGLSARRLWEYTELGQVNPFERAISERCELNDAPTFIDVVHLDGDNFSLVGLSLAQSLAGHIPPGGAICINTLMSRHARSPSGKQFVHMVSVHLDRCAIRQAVRNQHRDFLPNACADDAFGVPHIFSTLQRRLQSMGNSKAGGEQWLKTIDNFQKKGLRAEEIDFSSLIPDLSMSDKGAVQFSSMELANQCNFKDLRITVIPVIESAQRQLNFTAAPDRALKRTKKLPKAQVGQVRDVAGFDRVLGYRIEQVVHQTLWGPERHWQAVTHEGQLICDVLGQTLLPTEVAATALAVNHAKQHFPKRIALGLYSSCSWTGGKDYREWLITLPYYPETYLSGHFKIRNVLAHVRCDVREGADGERLLMLQEVQSDWAQRARRACSTGTMKAKDEVPPPFMKEWAALVMKLVLLHAAHQGLDAVAWTRGSHQVHRWRGLGAAGLKELYDRTLPREVNRIMKPLGGACETLGVFVPTNFSIKQTESGYEVFSPDKELLGTAPTLEDARDFVPDQGHELLYEVHGVRLPVAMRKAILGNGFPAWG
jgi:hypothetical protein